MPTIGWIQETAVERFLTGTEAITVDSTPRYACPHCDRRFFNSDELLTHLGLDHPLSIPALVIDSTMAASDVSVRRKIALSAFRIHNCTSCGLSKNGGAFQSISPSDLPKFLAGERSSTCELRLVNDRSIDHGRAATTIRLSFRIPDEASLKTIDAEFVRHLAVEHPRLSDVDLFREKCPDSPAELEYASALGDYVIGLAIKERHPDAGAHLDFENYKPKFASALAVLQEFPRLLARSIASLIQFNFNNFSGCVPPPQVPELAIAGTFFQHLATGTQELGSVREVPERTESICPVDIVTHRILRSARKLSSGPRPHPMVAAELEELLQWQPLSEYDGIKARTLCAYAHLRLGNKDAAERHLRRLQFSPPFDQWAQTQLN